MELGYVLPTFGRFASPEAISRVAVEAERIGYSSVWAYERLLRPMAPVLHNGVATERIPEFYRVCFDPLETLSYVAALTSRVRLGTALVIAPLHVPVVLARRFAALDRFSGGRAVAGLGQGWMPQEFETANVPMSTTGSRLEEAIAAMRACWGPDPVSYAGRHHQIAPSEVNPKPVQHALPILVGVATEGSIRRAGRVADGLLTVAESEQDLRDTAALFRDAARAAGRDPAVLPVVALANTSGSRRPMGREREFLGGSPDEVAADLRRVEDVGVNEWVFRNPTAVDVEDEVVWMSELYAAAAPTARVGKPHSPS